MEKLNPQQVEILYRHLVLNGTDEALFEELLDHLACEVEHYMWIGLPFETALDKVQLEANAKAVKYLRKTYQIELTMNEDQLRQADLDDIVFQFRNKAYGAYDLRQEYRTSLRTAMLMTVGLVLMLMALLTIFSAGKWSYLSVWGAVWLVGLLSFSYAVGTCIHQRIQQKYRVVR
ncbi:hypothetical protein GCM10028803_46560 [Larkinella knui]|uniref:DUF423 domain-containing protein n=1 Tax=Larkinella knui TaxID=2025310 RepID=A0A3P1CPK1_9BACT|nr:DUF423 domain-containing protein [Larkinella knui]RRB15247.1 DUF423 domain-containing protein [Larkinella knui]